MSGAISRDTIATLKGCIQIIVNAESRSITAVDEIFA
jgi:hypothetical protein